MNKATKIVIAVIALVVIGGGVLLFTKNTSSDTASSQPSSPTIESPANGSGSLREYTLEEVAKHNSKSDCWLVVRGSVYNVTSYVNEHPGGDDILRGCGLDATSLFESQGGEGSHSSSAKADLARLKIGALKQ